MRLSFGSLPSTRHCCLKPRPFRDAAALRRQESSCTARASGVAERQSLSKESEHTCETINVELGDRSYPIYVGEGLLDRGELLRQHIAGRQVLIVTNDVVAPLYLKRCQAALAGMQVSTVVLPDGEQHKDIETVSQVWDEALNSRLSRNCTFLALGGGVVGDMTGFAAAAYQRGVDFIQVPTTVMATVDSSVGGKTGVNRPLGKNMVGAFHQPRCVLIDTETLATLPAREHASGISEIVKYGLIRDAELFEWLEENMQRLLDKDAQALSHAIRRSCINKAEVVALDEREAGLRATLNLGHTFGHAMETWQGYGTWLHGEAVAAGMVMAADLSHRLGWIDSSLLDRTRRLLELAELPVAPPKGMQPKDFMSLMAVDKKAVDGRVRFILLRGPLGSCVITSDFDQSVLQEMLECCCDY